MLSFPELRNISIKQPEPTCTARALRRWVAFLWFGGTEFGESTSRIWCGESFRQFWSYPITLYQIRQWHLWPFWPFPIHRSQPKKDDYGEVGPPPYLVRLVIVVQPRCACATREILQRKAQIVLGNFNWGQAMLFTQWACILIKIVDMQGLHIDRTRQWLQILIITQLSSPPLPSSLLSSY